MNFSRANRKERLKLRFGSFLVLVALLNSLLVIMVPSAAEAVTPFASKFQTNIEGDIAFVANANMTCSTGCTTANSGTMVYVDADGTPASTLQAGGTLATFNSSTANMALPVGSSILYAGLFWSGNEASGAQQSGTGGAQAPTPTDRDRVYFRTPAMTGYSLVTALPADVDTDNGGVAANNGVPIYHAYANVTTLVQSVANSGVGTYSVANIQAGTGSSGSGNWAGWTLVVAYSNPIEHLRNLTVFNGFNKVTGTTDVDVPFGPFVTPAIGPVRVKIGVVAQDGDPGLVGDAVTLASGGAAACSDNNPLLSDAANPSNNFFNSSIAYLGTNVATRNPAPANTWGYDADIVQADNILTNGSTNACLRLKTNGDQYFPDVVTTAIELPSPKIVATKVGTDLNGGNLNPGDVIEYRITMTNDGDDIATNIVLNDTLPTQLTYVPGTITVSTGPNAGAKTDAVDADQGKASGSLITVYLGNGATASTGGSLNPLFSTEVTLRATVNASTPGGTAIINTAQVTYAGATIPTQVLSPIALAATTPLAVQANLAITKTDGVLSAAAGSTVPYTITVRNNGPQAVTGASVIDTLPASISSSSWTCSVAGQSVAAACGSASGTGNIATTVNLGVNDVATFVLNATINPSAAPGIGALSNTATVAVPTGVTDTDTTNNSATDTDDIDRRADISVTKSDGITNAVPGTALT